MPDRPERLAAALSDRYRIERELGHGGMATVYLAEDLKHERQVALKVLRPELAEVIGTERFLREIKITAKLHHPHILELYDSGEADGFLFFVMPFVEGETLRARLDRETQLPLDDAMRIAREVADALSYAHSLGVIHRDIKPENILLQSGHAVVADFGIARAVSAAGGKQLTETGLSIGTPLYMSPEQAAGEGQLDGRSDLYSLGCVFFEMLAGQPPFSGPTTESVIYQHVSAAPPPVTSIRPAVPAAVAGIVERALAKTPADRFNPAAQFAEALQAQSGPRVVALPPGPSGARRWTVVLGSAAIVVIAVTAAALLLRSDNESILTTGRTTQLTFDPGLELDPVLSPDGSMVAYAAGPLGRERIYLRPVAGGRAIALTDPTLGGHRHPQWTPDGGRISFEAQDGIFAVATLGGVAHRLLASPQRIWSHAWSPDGGEIAYAAENGVNVRSMESGETRVLASIYFPSSLAWSPDGSRIAAASGNPQFVYGALGQQAFANIAPSALWIIPTDGAPPVQVTTGEHMDMNPLWLSDGRLLFMSDRDGSRDAYVLRLRADGTPVGEPTRVTTGLDIHSMSLSADARQLVYSRFEPRANVWAVDIPPRGSVSVSEAQRVTSGSQLVEGLAVSSDGRWLAFDTDRTGNQDIFKMELPDGEPIQLTSHEASDFVWAFTWDGASLTGHTFRYGPRDPFILAADGSSIEIIARDTTQERYPFLSPDGRQVVTDVEVESQRQIFVRDRLADGMWAEGRQLTTDGGGGASWSPDGSLVLFVDSRHGIASVIDTNGRIRSIASGHGPGDRVVNARWSPDGKKIVFKTYRDDGEQALWSIARDGGDPRRLVRFDDSARQWLRDEFATDGRRIYFVLSEHESDVWVLELQP